MKDPIVPQFGPWMIVKRRKPGIGPKPTQRPNNRRTGPPSTSKVNVRTGPILKATVETSPMRTLTRSEQERDPGLARELQGDRRKYNGRVTFHSPATPIVQQNKQVFTTKEYILNHHKGHVAAQGDVSSHANQS